MFYNKIGDPKMNIIKLNKKLSKLYGGKVIASETKDSIVLNGDLPNNEDIVAAGYLAVKKHSFKHVVNNITLNGTKRAPMRVPLISDKSLDNSKVDCLIIGGGISGASILRELSRYNLNLLLIEKESDLANQASSRNDGQVHPGVDLSKGSLKQSLVKQGNRMYDQISKELDVPFKRIGQYAGFVQGYLKPIVGLVALERRFHCGIDDTRLVGKKFIQKNNPNYNKNVKFALYNPMAGVTCPYGLTIAYAENAVQNGAKVSLNTACLSMEVKDNKIVSVLTNRGRIYPKLVINCAGVFSDDVAEMANDKFFSIHPRKGDIIITDKKSSYLSQSVTAIKRIGGKGPKHTKGGGIIHTIHDNLLLGPNAFEVYDKETTDTNSESITQIMNKQQEMVNDLNRGSIITYFAGTRASTYEEDYIIEPGRNTSNIYHVAGIQSPGITTAPAVAVKVSKEIVDILKKDMEVTENKTFNPYRKGIPQLNKMNDEERDALIKKNPDYGVIVCRCEEISKGEIIDALNSPIKVPTIDGIKRRVRPGMGRCQGSFCMPLVTKIIADHEGINIKDVKKRGDHSEVGVRDTKEEVK